MVGPCNQAGAKYKQTPIGGDSVSATVTFNNMIFEMGGLGTMVLSQNSVEDTTNWTAGSTLDTKGGMGHEVQLLWWIPIPTLSIRKNFVH